MNTELETDPKEMLPRDLETLVFERSTPDHRKLIACGFEERDGALVKSVPFHDGEFLAVIRVDKSNAVSGTVIETEMEEEYLPLRTLASNAFVNTIREEYYDLLKKIKDECFEDQLYVSPQAVRLHEHLSASHGDPYDHPFAKDPRSTVYRDPNGRKWYALVMRIDYEKLDESRTGKVEIVNLKAKEEEVEKLVCERGIYPCYHMNKKSWITAVCDDTLSDRRLFALAEESRALVVKTTAPKAGNEWIVPANPKYYDLTKHFHVGRTNTWKQSVRASLGDIVYIYTAAPYSAILYKTEVVETDIPANYRNSHLRIDKMMRLKVLKRYPPELLTMKVLRTFGVRSMQGSKHVPLELKKVIDSLEDID